MQVGPFDHHYSHNASATLDWDGNDSPEAFAEKLEKYPTKDLIYYRDNPLTYKLNNKGFRTPDDFTDKSKGNVFIGCSHTFGTGHYLENTWGYMLSQEIGGDYLNLGVPGSSIATGFRLLRFWFNKFDIDNIFIFYPHKFRFEFNWKRQHITLMPHHKNVLDLSPTLMSMYMSNLKAENYYLSNLYAILYFAKVANVPVFSYITSEIPAKYENPNSPVETARDTHLTVSQQYTVYTEMLDRYKSGYTIEKEKDLEYLVEIL